jgi:hypothetical protein
MLPLVAADWTPKAGEDAFWTYGEKGILVTVKTLPKNPADKITVLVDGKKEVLVARSNLREPPSEEEMAAFNPLTEKLP